ncbi:hypothetical protein [Streptomyces africanus]|uniref:hypothetical protein n=1 Tax=Streptomyces africanus TaxID=231024 RepID=UPI00130230C9|nr:hypothetical protein [Streptomyces africanus]
MALTACHHTPLDLIPGLAYPPEWHQQQDDEEQAWLNAFILDPTIAVTLWKAT